MSNDARFNYYVGVHEDGKGLMLVTSIDKNTFDVKCDGDKKPFQLKKDSAEFIVTKLAHKGYVAAVVQSCCAINAQLAPKELL